MNAAVYTTDEAIQDGFIVRFPENPTFLDLDGVSYVQAEYGLENSEGEFESIGFCYEA